MNIYLGIFDSKEDVLNNFDIKDIEDSNILLAYYDTQSYTGTAWVLIENSGKLFEINGSHCSCMGLEGQWSPEETTIEQLRYRMDKGSLGVETDYNPETEKFDKEINQFKKELEIVLHNLEFKKDFLQKIK